MFEQPSLRCDKFTTHKFANQRQSNSFQSLDSSPRQGKQIQMLTVERSPRWLFCLYADHDYHPPSTVYLCRTYEEPHKAAHFSRHKHCGYPTTTGPSVRVGIPGAQPLQQASQLLHRVTAVLPHLHRRAPQKVPPLLRRQDGVQDLHCEPGSTGVHPEGLTLRGAPVSLQRQPDFLQLCPQYDG
jgi:hypothetical protein